MSLLWKLVATGSMFDWITPMVQAGQFLFGGMRTVDATVAGWTGNQVRHALQGAGIRCGWGMVVSDTVLLPVDDVARATQILEQIRNGEGTPGVYHPASPSWQRPSPPQIKVGSGRCPYCGTLQLRSAVKCPQCGAPR